MKEKIVEPLDLKRKVPYAAKFRLLADEIASSLRSSLQAGDIGDIEAAGRQALAAMLSEYADGNLPDKQAFAFLKSLAERKTPDPVQKVEQTTQVDMRVMVGALITDNPDALEQALGRAARARSEIAARLVADAPLSLGETAELSDAQMLHAEPAEVSNIRAGRTCSPGQTATLSTGRQPTEENLDEWAKYRNLNN